MTSAEAMECFLSIGIRANQMAEYLREKGDNFEDVYLVHLMGELHNNQLKVENWLWTIITKPSLPDVPD